MNSKHTSSQMAFAIFVGMFSGSLIALRVERSFLWLAIGMVSGGLVGYVSLNPRQMLRGIGTGIRDAARSFGGGTRTFLSEQTRIGSRGFKKIVFGHSAAIVGLILGILTWYATPWFETLTSWRVHVYQPEYAHHPLVEFLMLLSLFGPLSLASIHATEYIIRKFSKGSVPKGSGLTDEDMSIPTVLFMLVVAYAFSCPLGIVPVVIAICIIVPTFTWKAVRTAFLLVHCEERNQAGAYSAIGTATMWWIQASVPLIIVGCAAGALVGALGHRYVSARFIRTSTA